MALLGVFGSQGAFSVTGGVGVRNWMSSFEMTTSGSNGTSPVPLKPLWIGTQACWCD